MNAPAQLSERQVLGDTDDFVDCCADHRWFVDEGWLPKIDAVDALQGLAERWALVDELGQDAVQRCISEAFAPMPELPDDYVGMLVRDWELADERDRWRWTGELRPGWTEAKAQPRAPLVPQATIDAFKFVAALGDPKRLRGWLQDHSDVASALLDEVA